MCFDVGASGCSPLRQRRILAPMRLPWTANFGAVELSVTSEIMLLNATKCSAFRENALPSLPPGKVLGGSKRRTGSVREEGCERAESDNHCTRLLAFGKIV